MANEEAVDDRPIASPNSGPEPEAGSEASEVGEFNIKVSMNGVPLGWWTDNGSPEWWITAVPEQSDSTSYTQISSGGNNFIQKSKNNYLSYRTASPYTLGLKIGGWT
jgi:hypothetical protein